MSSSNSPPLNQSTVSKPIRPPEAIAANKSRARAAKSSGRLRACFNMRVNMLPGSRPTSSANMQNTSRLTKCATACGSWPRSRNDCASDAKVSAARSVRACRVSPGRRRSGLREGPLEFVRASPRRSDSSRANSWVRLTQFVQLVRMRNRAMSETISSGGFSRASAYCRSWAKAAFRLVLPLTLVFPGEVMAFPHIRPAVTAGVSASTTFEAVVVAGRVGFGRRQLVQQPAEVDEVLLRRRALLQLGGAPLVDELVRRHGHRPIELLLAVKASVMFT